MPRQIAARMIKDELSLDDEVLAERFGHYLFDLVFHVGGDETSEVELGITVQTMREYDC
jgi:hypothetical protein